MRTRDPDECEIGEGPCVIKTVAGGDVRALLIAVGGNAVGGNGEADEDGTT
jgi:hypothetical protein